MLDSEGYACHFCVRDVGAQVVVDGYFIFVLLASSSTVVLLVLLASSTGTTITGYSTERGAGGGEGGGAGGGEGGGAGGGEGVRVEERGEEQVEKEEVAVEVKVTGFIRTYSPRKNNTTALHRGWATQSPAPARL
jgi:hypothetical protein